MNLELPVFLQTTQELRVNLVEARKTFISEVLDYSHSEKGLDEEDLQKALVKYESVAEGAVQGTLLLQNANSSELEGENMAFPVEEQIWTIGQAVFFASTVCTTIGYGNIVPVTFKGRIFCIFFAMIGIPFTLTVIADYGNLFANTLSWTAKKCKSLSEF
jgi:potassium channel subfamily K, invertebrate